MTPFVSGENLVAAGFSTFAPACFKVLSEV